MQNIYKETMKEIINKQADLLYTTLKLEPVQSAGSNRRFCGAKRTRCGASGLNL